MNTWRVLLQGDSVEDIAAARDFYDKQSPGLGSYLVHSVLADIQSLTVFHGIHPVRNGCFRMLATKFPYGIYYVDRDGHSQVVAVLDLRRAPSSLENLIRNRL